MTLPTITLPNLDLLLTLAHGDMEAAHEVALFLNVDYWGNDDEEALSDSELDEHIEARLGACFPAIPESLEVWGYQRMRLHPEEPDPDYMLEGVYENLDGEYNSSDEGTEPDEEVKAAAAALCALIRRTYVPWNCEPVCKVTLDAADVRRKLLEFWPEEYGPGGKYAPTITPARAASEERER